MYVQSVPAGNPKQFWKLTLECWVSDIGSATDTHQYNYSHNVDSVLFSHGRRFAYTLLEIVLRKSSHIHSDTYMHSLRFTCTDGSVVLGIPSTRYQHCRYQVLGWWYRVLELVSFNTGYWHMATWTEVSSHLNVCFPKLENVFQEKIMF